MSAPIPGADRLPLPDAIGDARDDIRYALVIRPPTSRFQQGRFCCSRLLDIDHASLGEWATQVVIIELGNFVAIAAADPNLARHAARRLRLHWAPIDSAGSDKRRRHDDGSAGAGALESHRFDSMTRQYRWPNRLRWGESAAWVVADVTPDRANLWVSTTTPEALRSDVSRLLTLEAASISVFSDRSGPALGRLACDDAAADAALISSHLGSPVAIWLDADYQRDVDSLGEAEIWNVTASGSRDTLDSLALGHGASRAAPAMALLLTGLVRPDNGATQASPTASPYRRANAVVQGGEGSDVSRLFAEESFLDEWSRQVDCDPLELRLQHLDDRRGQALIEAVRQRAEWQPDVTRSASIGSALLTGRGFAYCHLPDASGEWDSGTRSAWIADVAVDPVTGSVQLTRIVVGQDAGEALDKEALAAALRQELLPASSPLLQHADGIDEWGEKATAQRLTLPAIDTLTLNVAGSTLPSTAVAANGVADRAVAMPMRFNAQALAPGTAAIANALFDATGQRFREPPFTAARIRAGFRDRLEAETDKRAAAKTSPNKQVSTPRKWTGAAVASLISLGAVAAVALPWKSSIAPIPRPAADLYSQAAIERGRLVAEAGDCAVCHTASAGGVTSAGGRAFETPFGTVYSTNITPDEATGIGNWSYGAFERAMRHGVSRDGHHLYPAFPYTAFAKLSDTDMQSLYAYLMAQPAVSSPARENAMRFPFNIRGLMAGWNLLNHDAKPFAPDPTRSALWNRGAYLAEGAGHCSACHSPRNAMGAEKRGDDHFAGALVDGWEAPALTALSNSPVPWTEDALYDYLRTGRAANHGAAAVPMAPVVAGLSELPESDVRAIAHYVASFMPTAVGSAEASEMADEHLALTSAVPQGFDAGEQIYNGACAACHERSEVPVFSQAETSLVLNSNLYSGRPDNVIQAILDGASTPRADGANAGEMPAFRDDFSDSQLTSLVSYLRARFAPSRPAWEHLSERIGELRSDSTP